MMGGSPEVMTKRIYTAVSQMLRVCGIDSDSSPQCKVQKGRRFPAKRKPYQIDDVT